jgi:tetratricopeptide (TPR) repeat protein
MQDSASALTKKAIEASLKGNWKEAIDFNTLILEKSPKDLDAKIRLGRAFLQIKEFSKAKRIFKDVLSIDPINPVALKNFKKASEQKLENHYNAAIDPKSLLKEPGTTAEIAIQIQAKRITAEDFAPAEDLVLKILKNKAEIYKKEQKSQELLIGTITTDIIKRLNSAKDKGGTVSANFINGNEKSINVILHASLPVFRGERQEVKPYIKPGSIDEPELEITNDYEE